MNKPLIRIVCFGLFLSALVLIFPPKSAYSLAFSLLLFLAVVLIDLNPRLFTARKKAANRNERIFMKKFGRWWWLAEYGSLISMCFFAILSQLYPENMLFLRLFFLSLALLIVWGLYLCALVASHKNDPDWTDE